MLVQLAAPGVEHAVRRAADPAPARGRVLDDLLADDLHEGRELLEVRTPEWPLLLEHGEDELAQALLLGRDERIECLHLDASLRAASDQGETSHRLEVGLWVLCLPIPGHELRPSVDAIFAARSREGANLSDEALVECLAALRVGLGVQPRRAVEQERVALLPERQGAVRALHLVLAGRRLPRLDHAARPRSVRPQQLDLLVRHVQVPAALDAALDLRANAGAERLELDQHALDHPGRDQLVDRQVRPVDTEPPRAIVEQVPPVITTAADQEPDRAHLGARLWIEAVRGVDAQRELADLLELD